MFVEKLTEFSDSQVVTVTAIGTVPYDSGATPVLKDLNSGQQLYVVVQVDTTVTAAGAATVTVTVESDSTANLATSPTVHATSIAIPKATLVAGYQLIIPLPIGRVFERYLDVRYTIGTGPLTAGAFSAFITAEPQAWVAYPDAL